MKFLHLLSTEASQSILLHCLNEPPHEPPDSVSSSGSGPHHNTTLRFRAWNKKDTLLEPHVLRDDCKVMSQAQSWCVKFYMKPEYPDVTTCFISCLSFYFSLELFPSAWLHKSNYFSLLFQMQDGSWHESHFFFHTQDSRQLPIVDIQTFLAPWPRTQRHLEISPVCFFWPQHPCCVPACMNLMRGCKMST